MKKLLLFLCLSLLAFNTIETPEDHERITYFDSHKSEERGEIPKIIHMIWLGSSPFPKDSQKRLIKWIEKHPSWSVNLWTDGPRPFIHARLKTKQIAKDDFSELWEEFLSSDNEAERAALLRLEILNQEGGLVIDHDVICKGSFDELHEIHDLYCNLKPLEAPILSSSVQISPHLLAAKPAHPLIRQAITFTKDHWKEVQDYFPSNDYESTLYRVLYRTQVPLDEVVFENLGPNDIVLHSLERAEHLAEKTWIREPDAFLKKVDAHLKELGKSQSTLLYFSFGLIGLNMLSLVFLWIKKR